MKKLGFIGMGNMASAIANGIVTSGFLKGDDMIAYDVQESQLEKNAHLGFTKARSEKEVVEQSEMILIAVKPQVLETVLLPLKDDLKDKGLISIALGYDFEKYSHILDASTRHIFVMPNTPAQVLAGMSLMESKHSLTEHEFAFTKALFSSIGEVEMIPSHLMNVAGAISGSAPAFIYMIIEALADGAVLEGMPRALAYKLVSQMVLGSGKMQRDTQIHPGILKDNVCSPGGSTIRGVKELEKYKVRFAMIEAIHKTSNK